MDITDISTDLTPTADDLIKSFRSLVLNCSGDLKTLAKFEEILNDEIDRASSKSGASSSDESDLFKPAIDSDTFFLANDEPTPVHLEEVNPPPLVHIKEYFDRIDDTLPRPKDITVSSDRIDDTLPPPETFLIELMILYYLPRIELTILITYLPLFRLTMPHLLILLKIPQL